MNSPSPQLRLPIDEIPLSTSDKMLEREEPNVTHQAPEFTAKSAPTTLAQQVEFIEELTDEVTTPPSRRWPWVIGSAVMLIVLSAQIAYFFTAQVIAEIPEAKPLLLQYCDLVRCAVALPKNAELMHIESSDLEAVPQQGNFITLHALLHNNASYNQAYPELELTLLDLEEKVIARRVFHPADYLKTSEDEKSGIAANRDASIKLHLDTTNLKPSGYKLFLFYSH
jgi:hypothetical protein